MKISINKKLIKRNKLINQVILYGAIGLVALGILITLSNTNSKQILIVYLVLVPAYVLLQINVFMADKWGRSPRLDEIITIILKGLDNNYSLYLYTTDIPYLLIGPAGIWIIKPYRQKGIITYNREKKKYHQQGGGNFLSKFFGQESISDIDRESAMSRMKLEKYFENQGVNEYPKPLIVNIFYNPDVDVQVQNAPDPSIKAIKLKDMIRKFAKNSPPANQRVQSIIQKLPIGE